MKRVAILALSLLACSSGPDAKSPDDDGPTAEPLPSRSSSGGGPKVESEIGALDEKKVNEVFRKVRSKVTRCLRKANDGMDLWHAVIALTLGVLVGDAIAYLLGRFAEPFARRRVKKERLERANRWFERHTLLAVLGARFVPCGRVPVFVAAGIARAPIPPLLLTTVTTSLAVTMALFSLATML